MSGDFTSINGVARNRNAALNASDATVQSLDLNTTGILWQMIVVDQKVLGAGALGLLKLPRSGLAAFDARTGLAKSWDPHCGGDVYALAFADNTLYVGGGFGSLGGAVRNSLGAVDAATGQATSWDPSASSGVRALAVVGDTVYVGGGFTVIGGERRPYVAAIDRNTGHATLWNPIVDDMVGALAVDSDSVYIGGPFKTVHGFPRNGLARLSRATGFLDSWDAKPNPGNIRQIILTDNSVYVQGGFGTIGGQPRSGVAALERDTARATAWSIAKPGAIVFMTLVNSTLFVGGQFESISGLPRTNVAAVDVRLRTNNVLSWNPSVADPYSTSVINALSASPDAVFVGGHFQQVNGEKRPFVAGFPFNAQLNALQYLPSSLFQVRLIGPLGRTYVFEASSDLSQWTPILTNKAPFVLEDLQSVNYRSRFYRARPQDP